MDLNQLHIPENKEDFKATRVISEAHRANGKRIPLAKETGYFMYQQE